MKHIFEKGSDAQKNTFLLLHGTGGTETDLLPVAGMIDESASILGVRGNVSEHGMPRFFKRLAEGVFDEEDLIDRTKELYDFIDTAAHDHAFSRDHVIAVGYSNGANIAASLLFHYQQPLKGAVLFHPMVPRRGVELPDLTGLPVFIGAGTNDPICKPEETEELSKLLQQAGAAVDVHWESNGHQLSRNEVEKAAEWYRNLK
ncbi:phospholipase/carboxylesterase [Alteribacillus persepolensis]|uniref:Phospholipase/carboxylesterase n=1 Tax=Alteribacillus persepolensis TaxID=568899 RepID=A0A1G8EUZ5_9BACI|nr:alpha/beta hydrolase [Alteribacillus persepolensis]SDH73726.1 phospholipase/carboxylesterase [Alteribacillus persepolensis]